MDKRKEANLRVKNSITQTVLRLLDKKSISEITISEIIREAGVARASFYRNYATKESVITTLIGDILEDYRKNMESDGDAFYTYENVHMSFVYFDRYSINLSNDTNCTYTWGRCITQLWSGCKMAKRKALRKSQIYFMKTVFSVGKSNFKKCNFCFFL